MRRGETGPDSGHWHRLQIVHPQPRYHHSFQDTLCHWWPGGADAPSLRRPREYLNHHANLEQWCRAMGRP